MRRGRAFTDREPAVEDVGDRHRAQRDGRDGVGRVARVAVGAVDDPPPGGCPRRARLDRRRNGLLGGGAGRGPAPACPAVGPSGRRPHAAARTGAAGRTGDVVLHGAIIAQDETRRRPGRPTWTVTDPARMATASPTCTTTGTRTSPTWRRPSSGWRPWRGPAGACSSWGRAAVGWRCRSPDGASRCGRSTPRPPCSTGCGPGPAATGSRVVLDDMARLADPALAEGGGFGVVAVRVQHAVQPHRHRRAAAPAWPGYVTCWRPRACWWSRRSSPRRERGRRGRRRRRAPPHRPRRGRPDRQPARPGDPHDHRAAPADHRATGCGCGRGSCTTHARAARRDGRRRGRAAARRAPRRVAGRAVHPGVRRPRVDLRPPPTPPTVTAAAVPRLPTRAANVAHPGGGAGGTLTP